MNLASVTQKKDHFLLNICGRECRFHFLWLRDNSAQSRTANGQRLHESNSIDPRVRPHSFSHTHDRLDVIWTDDTHSTYALDFLVGEAYDSPPNQTDVIELWNNNIGDRITHHDYCAVRTDGTALKLWLQDVERYGFGLLKNVPPVEGTILEVGAPLVLTCQQNKNRRQLR